MKLSLKHVFIITVSLAVAACASTRPAPQVLVEARTAVETMVADPHAVHFEEEADAARARLDAANRLFENGADLDIVGHNAYLAKQLAMLVLTQAAEMRLQDEIARADEKRQALLLRDREAEAERARLEASMSEADAERARSEAEYQQQRAEAARRDAQRRELEATLARSEAAYQSERAQAAEAEAEDAKADLAELQGTLENLQAAQTAEGLVLTLTDVLFDTDRSVLKPGAEETIDEIAEFLRKDDGQTITVKGHTDSRGADAYNKQLSAARANAVRDALIGRGVDAGRISAEGMGEAYPVATNDTAAGRQQNRRVEIVISDT